MDEYVDEMIRRIEEHAKYQRISQFGELLNAAREYWLNPPDLEEKELAKRTLTNLYNQRPAWLDRIHVELDKAVYASYGWEYPLSDEEILKRLLKLNQERAAAQKAQS